jgi:uncharacterized protein YbbC (DUF1343 family)
MQNQEIKMDNFQFGIEALKNNTTLLENLEGKRIGLLGHPASVDGSLRSSIDIMKDLAASYDFRLTSLFGPQHGFYGEKQDNMIESEDFTDDNTGLKTFSLYGETRKLTPEMIDTFDVIFVDLQDVGVRVYTFLTTLCYLLEDLSPYPGKTVIVLDRPNPTGRAMDGLTLQKGWESFVGITSVPMQHGLTLAEFAKWYKEKKELSVKLTIVPMEGYTPENINNAWPLSRIWVQPSPNMPALYTARPYAGTVILEGTTLSEARGTTRPLSMLGHPEVHWNSVVRWLEENASDSLKGCFLRQVVFQPTFHKHAGIPTSGLEIITEGDFYDPSLFKPYLLIACILKAIHMIHPGLNLWTEPPYEYEYEKIPVDVVTGGTTFREWVESETSTVQEMTDWISRDVSAWRKEAAEFFMY